MRKVLISTPCYDGKIDVWYANSLIAAIRQSAEREVFLHPVWMSYDALVQRARNDLVALAIAEDYDDIIFIDNDIEFNPEWLFTLLNYPVDVVGAVCVKKTDEQVFNIKPLPSGLKVEEDGLIEVASVGTGLLRVSRIALLKVWEASEPYINAGKACKMVFDVKVVEGELYSEDTVFCNKLRSLDTQIFIDPKLTCNHIGHKKYSGDFMATLK